MKLSEKVLRRELDNGTLKILEELNDYMPEAVRVSCFFDEDHMSTQHGYLGSSFYFTTVSVAGIDCLTVSYAGHGFTVNFKNTVTSDDQHKIINILKDAYSMYQDYLRNKELKKTEAISAALRGIK